MKARATWKQCLGLGWLLLGLAQASGADTNQVQQAEAETPPSVRSRPSVSRAQEVDRGRVVGKRTSYGGILVQATKSPRSWQWISPAAPASYGFGEENVVREPVSGRPVGLSFFTFRF